MGREIRRVPEGWEHPTETRFGRGDGFKPLHGDDYEAAARDWWERAKRWIEGATEDQEEYQRDSHASGEHRWYWDWDRPPPSRDDYVDYQGKPCTHFQIYETVTEGTPCSPVFATIEDLVEWMVQPIDSPYNRGADWQCMQGKTREAAEAFAEYGSAPTGVIDASGFRGGVDALGDLATRPPEVAP